jgi:hypothetical protein
MRGPRIPTFSLCLAPLLTCGYLNAADVPNLSKIDRHIPKQPVYQAK